MSNPVKPSDQAQPNQAQTSSVQPNQDHAEAVGAAIERKQENLVKTKTQVDPVESAILRANTALEGAVQGRVPDGDLIGFTVGGPVSNTAGVILLQAGEVISQESLERVRLAGATDELMAAIENPALGKT
jgi:hypothetical protein